MRIRMLKTTRGAADGFTVQTYEAGQSYELPETLRAMDLARVFMAAGWAKLEGGPVDVLPVPAPAPAVEPEPEVEVDPEPAPVVRPGKRR